MAKVLNNLLCTLGIFLLTFAWCAYCLRNMHLSLTLAGIVSVCSSYVVYTVQKKVYVHQSKKKKRKKLLKDFVIFLRFNCDNSALFMSMFQYYNYSAQVLDFDNITVTKNDKTLVSVCFENDVVSSAEIRRAILLAKRNGCDKLTIFCNKVDGQTIAVANTQMSVKFVDADNAYRLFEESETLPKIPATKVVVQRLLPQYAFNKRRFGWYFFGAVFMALTSLVSLFKLYSLVWATVMLALAIYSLLNRRYNRICTNVRPD